MKTLRWAANLFFGNSYLRPFEQSPFVRWLGPILMPLLFRIVRKPYLQAWALLLVIWALLMGSLPSLYIAAAALLDAMSGMMGADSLLFFSWMINLGLLVMGVWGMYYVTRLNLTKLYYWHAEKYPPWPPAGWPSASALYQLERYVFRPEFISLAIVTFIWIQLTRLLLDQGIMAGTPIDYQVYLSLWVPWLVGAVWPVASVFVHRQHLEV